MFGGHITSTQSVISFHLTSVLLRILIPFSWYALQTLGLILGIVIHGPQDT